MIPLTTLTEFKAPVSERVESTFQRHLIFPTSFPPHVGSAYAHPK